MNENLNLVEILKDCPKGTKLYSPVYEYVELVSVSLVECAKYPIEIKDRYGVSDGITKDGRIYEEFNGECMLFPSKEQRDWSKFNIPVYKKEQKSADKIEPRFNVGDWVVFIASESVYQVEKKENYEYTLMHIFGGSLCLSFSDEKLIREWTIRDAKDGDVLATSVGAFIYNGNNGGGSCPGSYCGINTLGDFKMGVEHHWTCKKVYPATKEQRDALMKAMNNAGYEWDTEKKELKKK